MDQPTQQTNAPSQGAEAPTEMQPDQNEVSIEITIKQDGSLTVGLEVGENEGEAQEVPAASIDEACAMAKKIYAQVMSQNSGDQQQEDSAYQQEMASPTR